LIFNKETVLFNTPITEQHDLLIIELNKNDKIQKIHEGIQLKSKEPKVDSRVYDKIFSAIENSKNSYLNENPYSFDKISLDYTIRDESNEIDFSKFDSLVDSNCYNKELRINNANKLLDMNGLNGIEFTDELLHQTTDKRVNEKNLIKLSEYINSKNLSNKKY